MNAIQQVPPQPPSIAGRCLRWLKRTGLFVLSCLAFYFLLALVGLIPTNNGFQPAADGIEVWFVSSAIHTDIVLPIRTGSFDWHDHFPEDSFQVDARRATHVAIGWGSREFYVNTPTWADLRASTVFRVLFWPSASCMHATLCTEDALPKDARKVKISAAQYQQLLKFIDGSFQHREDGSIVPIPHAAYGPADAFFQGAGSYDCFNTCNCWTGRALQAAGLRTGWYTPLPGTPLLYLPE